MNDDVKLFIVTVGYSYDGPSSQRIFLNEAAAAAQFEVEVEGLRSEDPAGDYVELTGPYAVGEDVAPFEVSKRIAYCNPDEEAREAAYQASLAKRREARRAAKAAAAV